LADIAGVKPALGTPSYLLHVPVKSSTGMAVLYMCGDNFSFPYQVSNSDYYCSGWVNLFAKMIRWAWATATSFCLLSSIQYVDHASELLVI
jgi:hypothetical protein